MGLVCQKYRAIIMSKKYNQGYEDAKRDPKYDNQELHDTEDRREYRDGQITATIDRIYELIKQGKGNDK